MTLLRILIILVVAALDSVKCLNQYELVPDDEKLFSPCEKQNTILGDQYFDTSNLSVTRLDDHYIYLQGTLKITEALPENTTFKCNVNFYKKHRGAWQNTILSLYRPDFCKSLFDTAELWYEYSKAIPKHQHICPLFKGQTLDINCTAELKIALPDYRLEGEYKGVYQLTANTFKETICVNTFFQLYRLT